MSKSINRGSAAGDQRVTAAQRGLVEQLGGRCCLAILAYLPAIAIFASLPALLLLDSTGFQSV